MGYNSPISSDSLRAYWPLFSFENYLNALFSDLAHEIWTELCNGLEKFQENYLGDNRQGTNYAPACTSEDKPDKERKWGRTGIEFFKTWRPGIFAGVILDPSDHGLKPLDPALGPIFSSLWKASIALRTLMTVTSIAN